MGKNDYKKYAIVYGTRGVNAVGLIRSLGQAGFYVIFASTGNRIESKWNNDYWRLPDAENLQLEYFMEKIPLLHASPALYPTDDKSALFLDRHCTELSKIAFCPNAAGNLMKYMSKAEMTELAQESGLNVPQTLHLSLPISKPFTCPFFPAIIKPASGVSGEKGLIRICRSNDELQAALTQMYEASCVDVVVQEFLKSENQYEVGLMGLSAADGSIIIPGTILKLRSYPAERGSTSFAQILPDVDNTINLSSLQKFVRQMNFVGLFDIEMIISNGVAYFVEINFRNGQYGYAITAAGVNLPSLYYDMAKGISLNQSEQMNVMSIYYMNEREDFCHVKKGCVSFKEWLKEFRQTAAFGMFCPGDQRPFIRQYIKIPDRISLFVRRFMKRLQTLLVREEWQVAYREKSIPLYCENSSVPFIPLKNSLRYWCADPFLVETEGTTFLFFEMYDRFKGKGQIGYREISKNHIGKMKVAYEAPFHLSFPYIFWRNGNYYMLPESSEGNELFLLKATNFPSKWVVEKRWEGFGKACDSVVLFHEDNCYLFTQKLDMGSPAHSLNIFRMFNDAWKELYQGPAIVDASNARLAGSIITDDTRLIRVAQNCSNAYGESISFHQILECSANSYCEKKIREVSIDEIPYNQHRSYRGIHTYNVSSKYEVVDFKLKCKARWQYLVSWLYYRFFYKR